MDVCQSPEGMRGVELSCAANAHKEHIIISVLKREFTHKSSFTRPRVVAKPCDFLSTVGRKRRWLVGCSRRSCAMKAEERYRSCDLCAICLLLSFDAL